MSGVEIRRGFQWETDAISRISRRNLTEKCVIFRWLATLAIVLLALAPVTARAADADAIIDEFHNRCINPLIFGERPNVDGLSRIDPEEWARLQEGSRGAAFRLAPGVFLELRQWAPGVFSCAVGPSNLERAEVDYPALQAEFEDYRQEAMRQDGIVDYVPCADDVGYDYYLGFDHPTVTPQPEGSSYLRAFLTTHAASDIYLMLAVIGPDEPDDGCPE